MLVINLILISQDIEYKLNDLKSNIIMPVPHKI